MAETSTTRYPGTDEIRRRLAVQVARIRASRGLTQSEVADRTGLIRTAISEIENGHRTISVTEWVLLADALSVDPGSMLAAALHGTPVPVDVGTGKHLAALSCWIDASNLHRDPEAVTWGRIAKLQEEAGETVSAFIGATGQNPRKGITHTTDDVVKELLDCAVTALGAVEHMVGNNGSSMQRLAEFVEKLIVRAGLDQRQAAAS